MAVAAPRLPAVYGRPEARVAPPTPARTNAKALIATAKQLGIKLFPWQEAAARYIEALGSGKRHLYGEIGIVVGRQNGKTEILIPLIIRRLLDGRRIMHTAQNRELPREVHDRVATLLLEHYKDHLPPRRGIRYGSGQEEIQLKGGGRYKIVAPTRGGARGGTNDDVIIDELREMDSFDFIGAAKPTLTASPDPQIFYLSNAGEETSVVLNSIRDRAGADPRLAYLEWSADPDRPVDDREGWLEANPAIGHIPTMLEYLEGEYLSNKLAGTLALFKTEHLCQWVNSTREAFVGLAQWNLCEAPLGEPGARSFMGIGVDPNGRRASAVHAWQQPDGTIEMRQLFDVPGAPLDIDALGKDLRDEARRLGIVNVGFDPLTDGQLARFFTRKEPIAGQKYANASARFVTLVESSKLRWNDAGPVGDDLTWTARKPHDESGSFQAVRANDERPITAALAAIRAVWLASMPRPAAVTAPPQVAGF